MKKISILLLTLVSLAFLGLYGVEESYAADTDVSFDITVVRGSEVTNELGIVGQFGQSMRFDPKGLEIDEFKFAYHILNGQVLEEASQQVMVSGSTNLIVVVEKPDHPVTTYIDTNGELLGVNDAPSAVPTKPGFEFDGYVQVEGTEKLVFVANYSKNNEDPILVSITGGTKNLDEVQYNDIVTLTPNEGEFSYWADEDGQVVSRKANYKFSALQDVTLTAVFEKPANNSPVIYLSNVSGINASNHSFLGYVEGDFVEYGLLASSEVEVLTFDTAGVVTMPSQSLNPLTNEFLRSVPESSEFKSFRAYGKLDDGTVVYSDNNFAEVLGLEGTTYIQDFSNSDFKSSVSNYSSSKDNIKDLYGFTWSYIARNDGAVSQSPSDDHNLVLGESKDDNYIKVIASGGISYFKADIVRANSSGSSGRSIALFVNDVQVVTHTTNATSNNIYTLEHNFEQSIEGIVTIELRGTGSRRGTSVHNMSWTGANNPSDSSKLYGVSFVADGASVGFESVEINDTNEPKMAPSKVGHTFLGWFDENDVLFDFDTLITRHITLTAKYEANEYTLTFDAAGGSEVAPITQAFGSEIVAPADPTRAGYTFLGWNPNLPTTMPSDNITLEGIWLENDYTITFDSNGGSTVAPVTQAYESEVIAPENPTLEGKFFGGWYLDAELTEPYIFTTMPLGDLTLYAKWDDELSINTITFDSNGGSEVAPIDVTGGDVVVKPNNPIRVGYTFDAWYLDSELTLLYDFDSPVNTDLTLYAGWIINQYTITFDGNGGTPEIQTITVDHGDPITVPADPTRSGYSFVGWFDTSDSTGGNQLNLETTYIAAKTYYARWEQLVVKEVFQERFNEASALPSGTSYGDATFSGVNGITWSVEHGQRSQGYSIDGDGVLLRRASDSRLNTTLPDGLSTLSIDFSKGYTGGTTRNVDIIINGITYEFTVNSGGGTDSRVFKFTKNDFNLTGQVTVSIKIRGTSSSNAHLVIDNFIWENNPQ